MSALNVETRELCAALLQTQQQLEMFTRAPAVAPPATPPTCPHVQAPPHSHIPLPPPAFTLIPYKPPEYPPVPANIYQKTPYTAYGWGGRQWRTVSQGRGGRRRNEGKSYAPTAPAPPPYGGTIPAANTNSRKTPHPTPTKKTTIGTCVFRVDMTSRAGTPAPPVKISNQDIRQGALSPMQINTPP